MNQVLGRTCGNAVEVLEAVRFMQGLTSIHALRSSPAPSPPSSS
jgi:thymidine phosphorylase